MAEPCTVRRGRTPCSGVHGEVRPGTQPAPEEEMKFNPDDLRPALKAQRDFVSKIREVRANLSRELKKLESAEAKKQFNAQFLLDRKIELKRTAQLDAMKLRQQAA